MAKNKEEIIYNFETVRLPYFGKFSVKAGRLKYIKDKQNEKM